MWNQIRQWLKTPCECGNESAGADRDIDLRCNETLSWYFDETILPKSLGKHTLIDVRVEIASAFELWIPHVPFEIRPYQLGHYADIVVHFQSIDGPNQFLGQTTLGSLSPVQPEQLRITLDADEVWTLNAKTAAGAFYFKHLSTVLAHEIGHSLGIGHLEDENALMHPRYSGPVDALGAEDIAALGK